MFDTVNQCTLPMTSTTKRIDPSRSMDKNEKKSAKNPRQGANPLSVITFKWLFRIFLTGYKRELEVSDLYSPLDEHSSQFLDNKILRLWNQELERCQKFKKIPSLFRVLVRCFGCNIILFSLCLAVVELVIKTMQPIMLANLLRYFRGDHTMERTEAYYWGTGIVLGLFLDSLISKTTTQELQHTGMKMRLACSSLIYRKVLKVPKTVSKGKTSIGQVINLLSNDVNRFDTAIFLLPYIWIVPLQIALISYLLYNEVGLAAFGGIAIILLLILIYGLCGMVTSYLTLRIAYRTDERLRLTNQIINGVKVIKMYAWEKPFGYLIDKAREKEVKIIRNNSMVTEMYFATKDFIPQVCLFVTVLVYILFRNNIDAEKVYLVTAYYNVIRSSLGFFFGISTKEVAEALVSIKRLKEYLLLEEIQQKSFINNNNVNSEINDNISLSFNSVTAKWNSESKFEALKQISFQLQSGSLTAVIGQVGAGKTSLFQAILQEIPDIQGEVKINGKISYASQEPWLFTSSIKQNILLGQPMDKERYEKVIDVCQLKRDYELLPYGENTLVGEKGMNLSGGQCARINLARAVYHEADIYLLDDPLSAVDTQVGKGIFEHCIKNFLKDKTVILITHQFQYLKDVDRILILGGGTLLAYGAYTSLVNSGLDLMEMMKLESKTDEICNNQQTPAKENDMTAEVMTESKIEEEQAESRTMGGITLKTYLQYFKAAHNGCLVFLAFLISMICQIFRSGADYFITYWVNVEEEGGNITFPSSDDPLRGRSWYIYIYASIVIPSVFISFAYAYAFCHMCMKISRNLHAMMFTSIIKSKMTFFNANSFGRIINRFSKDMGLIDIRVPPTIIDITQFVLYSFAIIFIVASVNPWFLIAALAIVVIAYFFRSFYIKSSRIIKRLEGITRSPVVNHLNVSVHGLTTIRALKAQQILISEFDDYQDVHSSTWFLYFSGVNAFGMYIEFLCTIFTGIVIYTLLSINDIAMAGNAGLVITQCMLLTGMVQWGMRKTTEIENQMTSFERILEYSKLEPEPLLESTPINKGPENWPQQGQILFKDVSLIYDRQEKPALRNLNFTIEPRQMIGIVGRTGAGKSSIITALFRLADIEGEIYVDNVATSKIALQDLRSKISIIPQEPVLFDGTLRTNLDPFDEYSDHELWQALEEVEMKVFLQSDLGLDMRVAEGGMNFSVGQRQLLCLARATIRSNKIMMLDEATANVDPQTDELIQKAVRKKFVNCTVLIIAHRLNTIMDTNKILVMDAGEIVEFDHPYNLLQQRSGVFYNMVQQTGVSTAENLFQIAKRNYEIRHECETSR